MAIAIDVMNSNDWPSVRSIYAEGLATGLAAFTTVPPSWVEWDEEHFSFGRLVARQDQEILGWSALAPVPNS